MLPAGWRRFRDHLKDVAKARETLLRTDLYTAYLPYAAGFGLAARHAQDRSQPPGGG